MATARKPTDGPERVAVQEASTAADKERIATMASMLGENVIEVGAPLDVVPQHIQQQSRMVVVRIGSEGIEDMSYNSGGHRQRFTFEAGHEYRVPVEIAAELERIGKVWH